VFFFFFLKMRKSLLVVLFLLCSCAESSWVDRAKSFSNFVWSVKDKIPEKVREKASFVFGGVATAYNIKWMWDCTFPGDSNTNRDEKIKGILINKLEADSSLSDVEFRRYKKLIISGGSEMNVVYSHCVENRWFHQPACIRKDLDEVEHEKKESSFY